jgi:hypothetical protein
MPRKVQKISLATSLPVNRELGKVTLHFENRVLLNIEVEISSGGLLSIGALIAMTLLSTAVLVRAAKEGERTERHSKPSLKP